MDERAGKGVIVYAAIISQGERRREGGGIQEGRQGRPQSPPPLDSYHYTFPFEAVRNEEFGSAEH